jgi:hypothetical protein
LISRQDHSFEKVAAYELEEISFDSEEESGFSTLVRYIDKDSRNVSSRILDQNKVSNSKLSDNLLFINEKIKNRMKHLKEAFKGAIDCEYRRISIPKAKQTSFSEKIVFDGLNEHFNSNLQSLDADIGVIDGGIDLSGIVSKNLHAYYSYSHFEMNKSKPSKNHAEMVCSVLLFANNLSMKTNDNIGKPRVHLFDVIEDGMLAREIIDLIEKIIGKFHREIKI